MLYTKNGFFCCHVITLGDISSMNFHNFQLKFTFIALCNFYWGFLWAVVVAAFFPSSTLLKLLFQCGIPCGACVCFDWISLLCGNHKFTIMLDRLYRLRFRKINWQSWKHHLARIRIVLLPSGCHCCYCSWLSVHILLHKKWVLLPFFQCIILHLWCDIDWERTPFCYGHEII